MITKQLSAPAVAVQQLSRSNRQVLLSFSHDAQRLLPLFLCEVHRVLLEFGLTSCEKQLADTARQLLISHASLVNIDEHRQQSRYVLTIASNYLEFLLLHQSPH